MEYTMPMVELLAGFYNQLKSRTQGYASLDYTVEGYQAAPLVKVDVLINQQPLEALSMIMPTCPTRWCCPMAGRCG